MAEITKLVVHEDMTLREALTRLDETARQILLLLDREQHLIRTITDGDIRRVLISGAILEDTLSIFPYKPSITVKEGVSPAEILALMNKHDINHVPVIDENKSLVRLVARSDIDEKVWLSTPHLGEYERKYIEEALTSNWVAPLGPNVDAFERELADYIGIGHAAALSSGTAALHLALQILNIGKGDVVFCSDFTFVASANPILYVGAEPIFIDAEPESWNMSPQALERALREAKKAGKLPKAVIIVHLYGQCADMDPLMALCDEYGVPIIEDAAESLGATYKGRDSGTMGLMGIFSFNGNKIITTSGGGMLVSHNKDLIEKARFLATQARDEAPYYLHTEIGFNYRMSNILAGIGRGQLQVLDQRVKSRTDIYNSYVKNLSGDSMKFMPEPNYGKCTHWLTACTVEDATPQQVIDYLAAEQIEARYVWRPMSLQPLYEQAKFYAHVENEKPVSHQLFETGLCLPSGSNMTAIQQERITRLLARYFSKHNEKICA